MQNQIVAHGVQSSTLSDVLERVLDKGVVIAGDIKVKLVDIELLSLQIRLVVCSVDKAREMGMDWWANNPAFCGRPQSPQLEDTVSRMEAKLSRLEAALMPAGTSAEERLESPTIHAARIEIADQLSQEGGSSGVVRP